MLSGNPVLNEDTFDLGYDIEQDRGSVMTMNGTVLKSATLVGITVVAATVTWGMVQSSGMGAAMPWAIGGLIVGLILGFVISFKPTTAPFLAPLYAVAEGLIVGAISAVYEAAYGSPNGQTGQFSGIVIQAVGLTLGVLAVMLAIYGFRIIRVTPKLAAGIMAAVGAAMMFYLITFVANLVFGPSTMPWLHEASPIGIGISVLMIGIAAFKLLLDFDLIEQGVKQGAPKYMEWYAGFALLVTLIWLYIEFLRLLSKLRSR